MTQAEPQSAFKLVRNEHIDSLNLQVEQYEHRATGSVHYHLAAENNENVFMVALRTVPHDSTGVAHILEHTALCGSEKYPVRDPFFMMLRRSLNTFMNAFTSSDWTAYPFASQNRKDFNNLLEVYMDAVFFSRLDPLDFAQEGHRIEFATPGDTSSELVYKGVVFNEMKGAMSSVTSSLWQTLCTHLFPSTTYHYNSGGDPACIPDLSYEELQEFYQSHYHPSNAIFMTFGDIPAAEHHQRFEELALSRFEKLDQRIQVPAEQRLLQPLRISETYAFDDSGSTDDKTHIVVGWMLGESTDLQQLLEAQLLASVLLDNSASPLQQALEKTSLGQAPSPLGGLEDSMREMVFVCGVEGSEPEHVDAVEALVMEVLTQVAEEGVAPNRLEAVLHQLELHQREISGDSYPYGLQLTLTALGCATHYSDPIAVLNLDPVLEQLQQQIKDPDYIKGLARKLLLENPHRVTLVMTPDRELSQQRQQAEAERLAVIKAGLDNDQTQAVVDLATALSQRQEQKDDESILPKVELSDVPAALPELEASTREIAGFACTSYGQGTNGLVYQQAVAPMPALDRESMQLLPYYSNILTEVGLGDADYLDIQDRQSATCGSINAFTSMRGGADNEQNVSAWLILSAKALLRNQKEQSQLMRDTLENARFDELDRIRELIAQQRARREQSVTGNGHGLAMAAASAGMSPAALLSHELSGLAGIQSTKALDDSLRDDTELEAFAARLQVLHQRSQSMPHQFLIVAEQEQLDGVCDTSASVWSGFSTDDNAACYQPEPFREQRRELWVANTQVNFCATAYPTVALDHPDSPALSVLGGFLRNGYLHRTIREQGGAYGGGASQDSNIGAFRFYSYRDPRLVETLTDFEAAIEWMMSEMHDEDTLEQAILGVIGSLDKPSSPAGEAKQHFHNNLFGRSHELRERFRQRTLDLTLEDLRRVTDTYLRQGQVSTAVITSQSTADSLGSFIEERGLRTLEL
ncbi:peptidase M16 [Halieaceae bacterium IMCC14734]|uniref:Peptidase M16 n=1 Tax=Candidatus Litorirhabdus singularis TaxID=2518993 RepID=A0ABT3TID6_9GAMM|nr:insulinase family protein [Candidatus Litorirhabdus singularis]MCX2982088.1 peptidase M16 [Candidatus Litorirhabdus singularis]